MIELTIPGKPIAKARPRFARRGKFVTTYNNQETEEGLFILECRRQLTNKHRPLTGPLWAAMFFYMPRPKAHYGTGRNAYRLRKSAKIAHIKKPDLDNLVKFVNDCITGLGLIWADDSQLISLTATKLYSDRPRTKVKIGEAIGLFHSG